MNFTPPIQGGSFRKHDHHDVDEVELNSPPGFVTLNHAEKPIFKDEAVLEALLSPSDYTSSQVRQDVEADLAKYPSLDADTQQNIALKFQALHQRVKDENFYDCRFSEYGKEILRYATLFALFLFLLHRGWYTTSACVLGLFWHQIMFSAHDAGHRGITHNLTIDTLIGIFIADLCCGMSIGWWKSSHNVHHLVTNHPVMIARYESEGLADFRNRSTTQISRMYRCSLLRMYQTSLRVDEASANHTFFMQTILLLVHQVQLLRGFRLPLGRIRQHRRALPTVHLLSRYGNCALQPLLPLLGAPLLFAIADEGINLVDPPDRDRQHCHLHLPLLLPLALPEYTDLALKSRVLVGQPFGHLPAARTDHTIALGHEYGGSRTGGVFCAEAVEDYDGH